MGHTFSMENPKHRQLAEVESEAISTECMRHAYTEELLRHAEYYSAYPHSFRDRERTERIAQEADIFTIEHNGSQVTLVGIAHRPPTIAHQEKRFLGILQTTNTIFIEGDPRTVDKTEARKIAEHVVARTGISSERTDELAKKSAGIYEYMQDFSLFFNSIAKIAHAGGKEVVSVDPFFGQDILEREVEAILGNGARVDKDARVAQIAFKVASGIVSSATAIALLKDINHGDGAIGGTDVTRRAFLGGVTAVTALAGLGVSRIAVGEESLVKNKDGTFVSTVNEGRYGSSDYRDLVGAQGVDEYVSRNPGKRIAVVYGKAHVRPMEHYLHEPTLRAIKSALYLPYKRTDTPKAFTFTFHNERWDKKELFALE